MNKITVRPAKEEDLDEVIAMIQELANFENMPEGPKLKKEDLIRDGEFSNDTNKSKNPLFFCNVAEIQVSKTEVNLLTRKIIGYSMSFYSYSTWQGKSLFLEDIYIRPEYRKIGAGKQLFIANIKFARESNCSRMDFHVLGWNPAKKFYTKMGAINLSTTENWEYFRMTKDIMDSILLT